MLSILHLIVAGILHFTCMAARLGNTGLVRMFLDTANINANVLNPTVRGSRYAAPRHVLGGGNQARRATITSLVCSEVTPFPQNQSVKNSKQASSIVT